MVCRPGKYVVVTIADNGVVHAWGSSKDEPYDTIGKAQAGAERARRSTLDLYGTLDGVEFKVCKILEGF